MRQGSLYALFVAALTACSGAGSVGDACGDNGDCNSSLQCLASVCAPRCERAPECGDGYACTVDGECRLATGGPGDTCTSESSCIAGYSCQIDGTAIDQTTGRLRSSCTPENATRPFGATCASDASCRNGTCALGHCVDLCDATIDCAPGNSCMKIPRVESGGQFFEGCLPSSGTLSWPIPIAGPFDDMVSLPVPEAARSVALVMSVDDGNQLVGAETLQGPEHQHLYTRPCSPGGACTETRARDQYFGNAVRHLPALGQSVLELLPLGPPPEHPDLPLPEWRVEAGAYPMEISSYRADGSPGTAVPHATAIVNLGTGPTLDLHFFFLDLDAHPCAARLGTLNATTAQSAPYFQNDYLGELRSVFSHLGIAVGDITYEDVARAELDGLDIADAGKLLVLGKYATGINIFFVRSLSPAGLQAYAPNPGPAGLGGTPQSGIILSVETLCYRTWAPSSSTSTVQLEPGSALPPSSFARTTAHEIARYMGLYHNIEADYSVDHPTWRDALGDNDIDPPNTNLMYYSEFGGIELSARQRDVLTRSGVLR